MPRQYDGTGNLLLRIKKQNFYHRDIENTESLIKYVLGALGVFVVRNLLF
jgi:hypothetical protein